MGKEDTELQEQIVPPVDEEITKLHSSGVIVEVSRETFNSEVEFMRSMNDGTMQKVLLGREGEFCVHTLKKRQFHCNKSKMVLR